MIFDLEYHNLVFSFFLVVMIDDDGCEDDG